VNAAELTYFYAILVPVLLAVALFFGWRQVRTLRTLGPGSELGPADRLYLRSQAYRRLVCSALLLVLAGLLAGSFWLDRSRLQVERERAEQVARNPKAPPQPEHEAFVQQFTLYWIGVLLVVLLLLILVAADVWAIARFSQRQHRQLRADLRDTLTRELARFRQQGNGRH
jgi:hypothetical protein